MPLALLLHATLMRLRTARCGSTTTRVGVALTTHLSLLVWPQDPPGPRQPKNKKKRKAPGEEEPGEDGTVGSSPSVGVEQARLQGSPSAQKPRTPASPVPHTQ